MPSLSAHLRETEDHSRLPFHPACPVCRRDRLAGSLDGEELLSRRTQAAIAAGLLAFSTGGVPAAVASPPDEVIEGTEEAVDDPSVVFDPGGAELQLPDEASGAPDTTAPSADMDDDSGPLEQEPATDVREPVVEANGHGAEPVADPAPTSEPDAAAPSAEEPPATPPIAAAESDPAEPQTDAGPKPEGGHRREAPPRDSVKDAAQPRTERSLAEPAPAPEPAPAGAEPAPVAEIAAAQPAPSPQTPAAESAPPAATVTTRVAARTTRERAVQRDRYHVVQPGESLWSIAVDLVGDRATVPRIAREVNRLWELNDEVIGTGRPDLLFAGTRLRLR